MVHKVHVLAGGARVELVEYGNDGTVSLLPAQWLVVEVEGDDLPIRARLDGASIPLALDTGATRGHFVLDAFRSVGFHRLELEGRNFIFATDDAKLKMDGIQDMLHYIGVEGLSWGSQLFFGRDASLRDKRIDYQWLAENAPRIVSIATEVARAPSHRTEHILAKSRPRYGRPDVPGTLRLVRRDYLRLLEPGAGGPLRARGIQYFPRLVVTRRAVSSLDTPGNRRITWLLMQCLELVRSLTPEAPAAARATLAEIQTQCRTALALAPFARLSASPALRLPSSPAGEERIDPRYVAAFAIYEQLARDLQWFPDVTSIDRLAHIKFADEIYQAFVALVLARALDAELTLPALKPDLDVPAFAGELYDIYYDAVPPTGILTNWRDASSRPTSMKPDLLVVRRSTGRSLLLDAKYRLEASGRSPASGLQELQTYMQAFNVRSAGICYPGVEPKLTEVSGSGNVIVEVSISPSPGLARFTRQVLRPRVEALLT